VFVADLAGDAGGVFVVGGLGRRVVVRQSARRLGSGKGWRDPDVYLIGAMEMNRQIKLIIVLAAVALVGFFRGQQASGQEQKTLDPKAWGANHAGQEVPEFIHGDECLFCHRQNIGQFWQLSPHARTVRQREDATEFNGLLKERKTLAAFDAQVEYFLGSRHIVRFLKKDGYGKFALLNAQAVLASDGKKAEQWREAEKPGWDKDKFANQCAGCHTTGIDAKTKAFAAFGLDCYVCHGSVNLEHSNDTSLILLSRKNRTGKQVVTSLCAQCHLREGKAKSTGLPYPNNFVAGDNLFQDYEVDWKKADDANLNPGDRHVYRNAREVAVNDGDVTCLNCHQAHYDGKTSPTLRHRRLPRAPICFDCHSNEEGKFKEVKKYVVKSVLCEY
jgi:hypothetical protein